MFIHWGAYSQVGRHEWLMELERWPLREYMQMVDGWRPKPMAARQWARLARQAGCRYMVMTSRHHDGFCMFNTGTTDYNAVQRGPSRDLVAEYVQACREQGLRVGLYYSLGDWHHPDWQRGKTDARARRRFVDYVHQQVRELCTNYGKLDILWYDGGWNIGGRSYEPARLNAMVRGLQPDILINNRSDVPEDFGTPEGHLTAEKGGRMWESCMTTNDSWGYAPIDHNWKTPLQAVMMLRDVAATGGNLLLNIGPDGEGNVPPQPRAIFQSVGRWMEKYGPAIYEATDPVPWGWYFLGRFTAKGNRLYFHCYCWPGERINLGWIGNRVRSVRLMGGPRIVFRQTPNQVILTGLPKKAPDPLATVIELELDGKPRHRRGYYGGNAPRTLFEM
jgi:alpha-L-fucosidase